MMPIGHLSGVLAVVSQRSVDFPGELWAGDTDLVSPVHRGIANMELKTSLSESEWRIEVPGVSLGPYNVLWRERRSR